MVTTGTVPIVRLQAALSFKPDISTKCPNCEGSMQEKPTIWVRAVPGCRTVVVSMTNVPALVCTGTCLRELLPEEVQARIDEIEQVVATAAQSSQGLKGLALDPNLAVVEQVLASP